MLVLSRRENQKVQFPGLGISVEILQVKGSKVRVGVEAPLEVRILRDELHEHEATRPRAQPPAQPPAQPHVIRLPQTLRHELRNALHELSLMLHVYRKRIEVEGQPADEAIDPESMFGAIVERLEGLGKHQVFAKSGLVVDRAAPSKGELGVALVVDDDANERELLAGFLKMCGYEVATAADGLEALDYLDRNASPRFILLDMQMPRCDGQAFLSRVRQREDWNPIHLFVVSGQTPSELGLSPEDGYTHWFHKPLDPRLVVEELACVEGDRQTVA